MRLLAALAASALGGCWQTTLYVGPRVDPSGRVGVELGASLGAATRAASGAVAASIDTSTAIPQRTGTCCTAARTTGGEARPTEAWAGSIRAVVEWVQPPAASHDAFLRAPGIGWRVGAYGGTEIRDRSDGTRDPFLLLGATASVSPWVWGFEDATNRQFIALGVQLATELVVGDHGYEGHTLRAALACELLYLPSWR